MGCCTICGSPYFIILFNPLIMDNPIIIGCNQEPNGTFNFYCRSKSGWKYQMNVINCFGAEDFSQVIPNMTQDEYNAAPNQLDTSFLSKIKS